MKRIIIKYLEGRATEAEQRKLLEWLRDKDNRIAFRHATSDWKRSLGEEDFPGGSEGSWQGIQGELLRRNYYRWQRNRKLQFAFRYAAVIFFIISVGGAIWYFTGKPAVIDQDHRNIISQGGQVSRVVLPDSSEVWLNSGTTIAYNNKFSVKNRAISLTGEAYFDVSKDDELPFVVDCNGLKVRALGTKFSAMAYPGGDMVEVVLEEGLVALNAPDDNIYDHRLSPGELARYEKGKNRISVRKVNTKQYTVWRNGIISIFDQPLDKVVERLEKRYDQKFEVDEEVRDLRYTFTIKGESLDKIIRLMERITPVKAHQEDEVIVFEPDRNPKKENGK